MEPVLEDVQIEQLDPRTAVVSFVGEHDMATADAVEELLGSLIEQNDLVVSDLSEAEFVDSSTMRALVHADREAKRQGHTFRLQLGTAPIVRRAFEISGLYELLDICPTREEALAPRAEQMPPFTATLPHDPIHLRGLRRSLTTWFEAEGVPEQCRAPLMLATHEAAANAIKHGEVDRPVRVTVTYGAESLSVVVRNDPRWGESDLTPGPRGLAMMRELMSEVRPTTTVRMRSDL